MDNLEYDPNRSSRTADTQYSSGRPDVAQPPAQTFNGSAYDSSLEDSSPTVVGGGSQYGGRIGSGFGKKSLSPLTYNRKAMAITGAALAMILLIGVSAFSFNVYYARKAASKISSDNFKVGKLDTTDLKESTTKAISEAEHLDINGQLQVGNTIILTPTQAPNPATATAGQIYYDKTTNQPYYYNGTTFVSITQQAGVLSLGGTTGAIGVGDGLVIAGSRISASSAVLQAAAQAGQPHVNTVQGQSGTVNLFGGAGIAVNGTTFNNTGVLSVNGGTGSISVVGTTNQLNVATYGSTVTLSLPQDIDTSASPSFNALSVLSGLNLIDSATSNATTLVGPSVGTLSVNQTISIPQTNFFANTDEVCLFHLANCSVGGGGGVAAAGGSAQNYITKFTNAGATQIGNSLLYDNGVSVGINTATPSASYLLDVNGDTRIHGAGGLTLGVTSSSTGILKFANSASSNLGTLSTVALNQSTAYTLPDPSAGSDIICLQNLGNCTGGVGGSNFINNATAQQSNANFNIVSRAGFVAAKIQGAAGQDIIDFYTNAGGSPVAKLDVSGNLTALGATFNGNATVRGGNLTVGVPTSVDGGISFGRIGSANLATLTAAAVGSSTTITIPDPGAANDTVCLQTLANCTSGSGGSSNFINNNTTQQANANFNILSKAGFVAAKIQGAVGQDIIDIYTNGAVNPIAKFTSTGALALGIANNTAGQLVLATTGAGSVTIDSQAQSSAVAISVPTNANAVDTFCLVSLGNCGSLSGNGNYIQNATAQQTNANFNIKASGGVAAKIQGAAANDILDLYTSSNSVTPIAKIDVSGNLTAVGATFSDNVNIAATKTLKVDNIQQTAGGNSITIDAGVDGLTLKANGKTFTLPSTGIANQVICTSGISCVAGGGTAVTIDPTGAQDAPGAVSGIFINKSGSGNVIQLQAGGTDAFVINNSRNTTFGGDVTLATGKALTVDTINQTGNGNAITINAGNDGITFNANGRSFTFPTNGAVSQTICTTGITCASGGGAAVTIEPGATPQDSPGTDAAIFLNKSGASGNIVQLQSHGTDVFVLANNGNATLAKDVSIQGTNGLNIGIASSVPGKLVLATGQAGSVTIDSVNRAANLTVSFPANANPTDTFCLVTLANCGATSGNGNYIQNSTAQQTNANYNIQAQTGVAAKMQGASGQDIIDLYLNSNGSNPVFAVDSTGKLKLGISSNTAGKLVLATGQAGSVIIDSVNRAADLTVSFPADANPSDTFCLVTLANCGATSGNGNYIQNGTGQQTSANFNIQSVASQVAAKFQGASGQDIAEFFKSTDSVNPIAAIDGTGILSLGNSTTTGALKLMKNGSANSGSILINTLAQNSTYYLPDPGAGGTDTFCLVTLANCTASAGAFIANGTSQQTTANFNIQAVGGTVAAKIQGAASNDILDLYASSSSVTPVAKFDSTSLTLGSSSLTGTLKLGVSGSANIATIQSNTLGQASTIFVPDPGVASDTFCLVSLGNCSGANGGSGNSNYIQNGTAQQNNANFNIKSVAGQVAARIQGAAGQDIIQFINSGSVTVAKVDSAGLLTAAGATISGTTNINAGINSPTNINTGSSTGAVAIGNNLAGAIGIISGSSVSITGGAASTISTTAGNLTLQGGSGTVSLGTSTNLTSSGALTIASGGSNTNLSLNSNGTGGINIGNNASGNNAIQIGNTSGTFAQTVSVGNSLLSVVANNDSTSPVINPSFETNAANWNNGATRTVGASAYGSAYGAISTLAGNTTYADLSPSLTTGNTYTVSFYAKGVATVGVGIGGLSVATCSISINSPSTWTRYTCTGAAGGFPSSLGFWNNSGSSINYSLDAVRVDAGAEAAPYNRGTTVKDNIFALQNAAGINYFVGDPVSGKIAIGKASATYTLDVNGDINVSSGSTYRINGVDINTGGTLSNIVYKDQNNTLSGNNTFNGTSTFGNTVTMNGSGNGSSTYGTLIKNTTDSTTAFAVQNAAGTNMLSVDNTGASGNPVINPSFETNATNWNNGATRTVGASAFGSAYGAISTFAGNTTYADLSPSLTTGNTYTASFYAKGTATVGVGIGTIGAATCTISINSPSTWTRYTCTGVAGAFPQYLGFWNSSGGTITYSLDAVKIDAGDYGNPFSINNLNIGTTATIFKPSVDAAGVLQIQNAAGKMQFNVDTSSSSTTVKSPTNSTTAFSVQNASGSSALTVDTTPINSIITNQSFENGTTGWAGVATSAFAQTSSIAYSGSSSLQLTTNATANAGAKYTTGNGSTALATAVTTYTLSWYSRNVGSAFTDMIAAYARNGAAETNCTGINTQTVVTTGWTRYTCQIVTDGVAPAANAYLIIKQVGATSHQFAIDGVQIETGTVASSLRETGIQLNGRITNALNIQNTQDSTTAFTIQSASGATLFTADTLNGRIGVGTSVPIGTLHVNNTGLATANQEILTLQAGYSSNSSQKAIAWRDGTNIVGQIDTRYDGTSVDMVFGHLYNGSYQTGDVLTIKGTGNVGVGTTGPSAKLHVVGTKAATVASGTPNAAISGLTVLSGAGGDNQDFGVSTISTAGAGGGISLTTGAGGDNTAYACPLGLCSGGYGGAGGLLSLNGGVGGTVTTSAITFLGGVGGTGGTVALTGGNGGVGYFGGAGGNVTLQAGTGYAGTGSTGAAGSINLQATTGSTINVGANGVASTINIGNTTTGAVTQTINIGTNTTASSSTTVKVGSLIGTSPLTLQSGTSGILAKGANSTTSFQIQNASSVALFTADTTGMVITIAGNTTTFGTLQISNAHFKSTQTNAPTIGTPTNCGTSPTAAVTANSTDSAGAFTITAGTGGGYTSCDTVFTFNKAYGAAPKSVIVTPKGNATASAKQIYVSATSTTTFTVKFGANPAGDSEANDYYYWVVE